MTAPVQARTAAPGRDIFAHRQLTGVRMTEGVPTHRVHSHAQAAIVRATR